MRRLGTQRLWLPDYFCHEVARGWGESAEVLLYEDDPRWDEPRWETLQPEPRDAVIAVNYFGVRTGDPWFEWRREHECVLVEDHAHDPASPDTSGVSDPVFHLAPAGEPVALMDCPPGLFMFGGTVGFKSEYGGDDTMRIGHLHLRHAIYCHTHLLSGQSVATAWHPNSGERWFPSCEQ